MKRVLAGMLLVLSACADGSGSSDTTSASSSSSTGGATSSSTQQASSSAGASSSSPGLSSSAMAEGSSSSAVIASSSQEQEASSSAGAPSSSDAPGSSEMAAASSSSLAGSSSSAAPSSSMMAALPSRDSVLGALRMNLQAALLSYSAEAGWPVKVQEGWLVVTTGSYGFVVGDSVGWNPGVALTQDAGFRWAVIPAVQNDKYKFREGSTYVADPWARSYKYDENGEISLIRPTMMEHIDRWPGVGDDVMQPRTVRVLVPDGPITHVLYAHDGQNLFDPDAPWGGWKLQDTTPAGMLVVGIDNTPARMDEYTHVPDRISSSGLIGGQGDAYADFLKNTVRPLIRQHYGETGPIGTMGSSLGGLISFHIADRHPGDYDFAASLSGTMGWGSIGNVGNDTMMDRYIAHGMRGVVLYLDSGGNGPCGDQDGDGDDDDLGSDNYCENIQMRETLYGLGYVDSQTVFHWHEPGAEHNEAAWAARVSMPLGIFNGL